MAFQSVTHSCGHEHRHQLYGPHRERDRKADWMSKDVCPACKDSAKLERAANQAAECTAAGLPELTGSAKQIAWALDIRANLQGGLQAELAKLRGRPTLPGKEAGFARVVELMGTSIDRYLAEPSAPEWIERRGILAETIWNDLARQAMSQVKEEGLA